MGDLLSNDDKLERLILLVLVVTLCVVWIVRAIRSRE